MKILITGATGFIGSHLCDTFYKQGHHVFALARNKDKFNHLKISGKLIEGSISPHSEHSWIDSLPDDLDAVIHTAGIVHSYSDNPFFENNAYATKKLIIDLSRKYPKLCFNLISSLAAYGQTGKPINAYGKSKELGEVALTKLAPAKWTKIIIRPPIVIGPRDHAILDIFKMIKNRLIPIPGLRGKDNIYSFICIHDLTSLIIKATLTDNSQTIFASHPDTVSFNGLVSTIQKRLEQNWLIKLPIPLILLKITAKLVASLKPLRQKGIRLTPDKVLELSYSNWTCPPNRSDKSLHMDYTWDLEKTIDITYQDYKERKWI